VLEVVPNVIISNVVISNTINTVVRDQTNIYLDSTDIAANVVANSVFITIITDEVNNVATNYISSNTILLSEIFESANATAIDFINSLNVTASFDQSNAAQTIAISAFSVANSALPNTSDVSFDGNLFFPTGNIGIGRNTATHQLDINGTINAAALLVNGSPLTTGATLIEDANDSIRYVTFANNITGTFIQANVSTSLTYNPSTGTLSATIFNSTSDLKKKYDVNTIENSLDIINNLRGVGFKWKDTDRKSYGLIAQEVEKVIPELVETDQFDNKTLNYDAIIGFLVEAIKELKKNG
jgi:hypothetical protein